MRTVLNISIDDVCPHPVMGLESVERMIDFSAKYPSIKCSLFVPTRLKRYKYNEKEYPIENYPDFIDKLKSLPKDNFEICYHGHMHGNVNTKSNNDEFRYFNEIETNQRLNVSKDVFCMTGLNVTPVFRPPGFWMSPQSFAGCKIFGIKTLALNNKDRYIKSYSGEYTKYNVVFIGRQPSNTRFIEIMFHAGKDQKDFLSNRAIKELDQKIKKWTPEFKFLGI